MKNISWLGVAEAGSRIARGLLALFAARLIGAEGMGLFAYTIALGGIITFFEDAGIATYVTRFFAQHPHDDDLRKKIVANGLFLKLALGIVAGIIFLIIGPMVSTLPQSNHLIPLVALLLFSDALRGFFFGITRGDQQMHKDSGVQIITNILIVTIAITLLLINPTPLSLVLGYLIGSIAGTIAMIVMVRKYLVHGLMKRLSQKLVREILYHAWPFTIIAITNVLIFNTDSLFLGYYTTASEVGLYGVATRLVHLFYIIPGIIGTSMFPVFVQKIHTGGFSDAFKKAMWLTTILGIGVTGFLFIIGPFAIPFLFGSEFIGSVSMVYILAFSCIPIFITSILNQSIIAQNLQQKFIWSSVLGIAVNIGLDILLIPSLGGVGAAIASITGLTVIMITTGYLFFTIKTA